MERTHNYNLEKPLRQEFYDVNVHNRNMDNIDETLIKMEGSKETKAEHSKTKERVTNLENTRAMKNGSTAENFSTKELNASEVKVNGHTVYHTGRKPNKVDVGLGNVDNYPSSDKHDILDGTGNKFVLQKAVKAFYDKFVAVTKRVGNLENNRAMKNGSSTEDFNSAKIFVNDLFVNNKKILEMPSNSLERGPFNPIAAMLRGAGKKLYGDEEFKEGTNNVHVYNNERGSAVTLERIQGSQEGIIPPNSSGYVLKIKKVSGVSAPGYGGFHQEFPSKKNHTFVQLFQAKVPKGKTLNIAENPQGNNSTSYWLTNNEGTGKWEWYIRVSHCGDSGGFSGGGHIFITEGSDSFTWYLASCTIIDVTDSELFNNYNSSDKYTTLDGDGNKFVLQKAMKAFYDNFVAVTTRVGNLENNRAMKNGSSAENFSIKELNASEIKVNGHTVYHTGRKPNKADVGLGSVDNFPSSDKYTTQDGDGNKFVLQKSVKAFYDKFVAVTTRVGNLENNRAMKNGSTAENFSTKELNASEVKVNGHTIYHTGRKPNKSDVGLGNLLNYLSSSTYNKLDGDGNKYALQKGLNDLYQKLKQDIENVSVIGEPVMTMCKDLPNSNDFSWCDGGVLKKSDYPRLWSRVESTVNEAVKKVTARELTYGVNYFGWYIGDSDEFFRKPNLNIASNFTRPSNSRFVGHYEADLFKSHGHSGNTSQDNHSHTSQFYAGPDDKSGGCYGIIEFKYRGIYTATSSAYSHHHSFNTNNVGGGETRPKNVAVKYYCRIQ